MKNTSLKGIILLLITASVWGVAFVAQSSGMEHMNAFAFNCIRNIIAVMVLLPIAFYQHYKQKQPMLHICSNTNVSNEKVSANNKTIPSNSTISHGKKETAENFNLCNTNNTPYKSHFYNIFTNHKDLLLGGFVCGTALCIASNFQQLGMAYSTVGKSAFITTLYIVLVPILGLFLKKKVPLQVWFGVLLAMIGLYLLCMKEESFVLGIGDIYLLLCAFFFTLQIMLVDYYVTKTDGLLLSIMQFFVTAMISGIGMIFTEIPSMENIINCIIPLFYAGGISSGVGYTLQIIGQKYVPATIASLIMSLESVIATLAGWLLLHEVLSQKELIGCTLVFIAVLLTQIPVKSNTMSDNVKLS